MSFSYATPGTGPSAGGIGWFNFGDISINPGDTLNGLTGTLNDGTVITFNMSLALVSGTTRTFVATQPPTYPGANFAVTGYTGITGNVAMYGNLITEPGVYAFTISNITATDIDGNPVLNYTVLIADAEVTNAIESWNWVTNGGNWVLFASLGNNPPTLTGVGTTNATIAGVAPAGSQTAYVLATQTPTQLVLTATDDDNSRQAFAIGFATTHVTVQKNVSDRIDPSDQFVLNINGTPSNSATTSGSNTGLQTQTADIFAIPGNSYTINESIAPGSASSLSDYRQIVATMNATPGGTVPPAGTLPISFTPALGDDITYFILNAAPETFVKTVDKAYADIGELLTYTVTINNPNNFAVSDVVMTDSTPIGTTYAGNLQVSAPYTGTDPASGITITSIPADGSVTVSWQVQVNTAPPIPNPVTNSANITVPGGTSGTTNIVSTQISHAAVGVTKSVNNVFASPGDVLTYTFNLVNMGNTSANNVTLTDAIPQGTSFIPGSLTGATGTPPNLTLNAPIAAGASTTVTFQVQVGNTIPNPNPIPNTATSSYTYTVDPANPNGATGNTTSNTTNTQVSSPLLTTAKSVDKTFASAGDVLTYSITLNNTGNTVADNVVITDPVPSGTTFVSGSVTGATGTPPNLTLTSPIPVGGSSVVTFQVLVGNSTPNPVPNSATANFTYTTNPADPNGETGSSTSNVVNTQVGTASVAITKKVNKAYAAPGDILTYTLNLQNTGNVAANNLTLTDVIPAGTSFVAGSVTGATGTPPTLTLPQSLLPGETIAVTFQVQVGNTVPSTNPIPNTASAAFTYTIDPSNPNSESGTATSNTVTTQVNIASVTTTKSVDKPYASPGDILTYTVTLQNSGNTAANNVIILDTLPAGSTFIPGSVVGATGTPPKLSLTNPIPAGGIATVSFQVKTGNNVNGTNPIVNTAKAVFNYMVDPTTPNGGSGTSNGSTVSTQLNSASLKVVKSVNKKISYLSDIITYQIAVTNTGNAPANNVVITDLLQNGTQYVPGSLTVSVPYTGALASGLTLTNPVLSAQTIAISFQVKVIAIPNPNPIVNAATATYTYTIDPSTPNSVSGSATSNQVNTIVFRYNFSQQITDLIQSVAQEQAALANIANAEGAKIQALVAMGNITTQELLCVNKSVADMIESITMLETVLRQKLNAVSCQIDSNSTTCK